MAATSFAAVAAQSAVLSAPIARSARKECTISNAQLSRAFFGKGLGFVSSVQKPASFSLDRRSVVVKAQKKEVAQVIEPLNGDPFIGMLETPVTSSPLVAWYLSNLPAYQTSVNPLLRGVEVGLAHGYLLVGPFTRLGPLRNTDVGGIAGAMGAAGLVVILSVCLSMYGIVTFQEGSSSSGGLRTLTLSGRAKEADKLQTADGWAGFTGGFLFGGLSGAAWAYFLLQHITYPL